MVFSRVQSDINPNHFFTLFLTSRMHTNWNKLKIKDHGPHGYYNIWESMHTTIAKRVLPL